MHVAINIREPADLLCSRFFATLSLSGLWKWLSSMLAGQKGLRGHVMAAENAACQQFPAHEAQHVASDGHVPCLLRLAAWIALQASSAVLFWLLWYSPSWQYPAGCFVGP